MLGRRGPVQAAFTPPELQELGELAGADVIVDPAELELDPASEAALERRPRTRAAQRRAPARVRGARAGGQAAPHRAALPRLAGRDPRRRQRRGGRDRAQRARRGETAGSSPRPTGEMETIECGLVLAQRRLPRRALPGVPFDEQRVRDPERGGRVVGAERTYCCAGWIKRGPSGVIGTNKKDATETVERCSKTRAPAGSRAPSRRRLERAARREGRRLRRVCGLAGDRRRRARRGRAARPPAREADRVGAAAGHRAPGNSVVSRDCDAAGALGRRDAQGGRQLPGLRRADSRFPSHAGSAASRPPPRA